MQAKNGKLEACATLQKVCATESDSRSGGTKDASDGVMIERLLHILAVDDEVSVRLSLSFALVSPSRTLATACDGDEALAKIATNDPEIDIVITDNNMPKVSGLDLVRFLRETKFAGKIVVLSAFLDGEIRNAYAKLGVDLMLPKPFEIVALRAAIQNLSEA